MTWCVTCAPRRTGRCKAAPSFVHTPQKNKQTGPDEIRLTHERPNHAKRPHLIEREVGVDGACTRGPGEPPRRGILRHQPQRQRLHHTARVSGLWPVPVRRRVGVHAGHAGLGLCGDDACVKDMLLFLYTSVTKVGNERGACVCIYKYIYTMVFTSVHLSIRARYILAFSLLSLYRDPLLQQCNIHHVR